MKKLFIFAMLLFLPLLFFGCSEKDVILKASENLNSYSIVASLDVENKTLSAKEEVCFLNSFDEEIEFLMFHLHPNAFKENRKTNFAVSASQESRAYDNEKSYGEINILSVFQNGNEISFFVEGEDEHLLKVELNSSLKKGESTKIEITFMLKIPKVNHRFGYGQNTINLGNFYPILCVYENGEWDRSGYNSSGDPFYSQMANYQMEISYDKSFVCASTGNLFDERVENGVKTSKYNALAVRDFAMVFSNKFETKKAVVGQTEITYYYFDDQNSDNHLKTAVDAVNTFNELFGLYPYKTLSVVKADFLHGGMEYPNLVYVSNQVTNEAEYDNVIVHEIAHQWWYCVVGNNQLKYGFIDEGLAEYSTALFYDLNSGYSYTKTDVIGNALSSYLLFCDVYKQVYGTLDTSMNREVSTFNTETEYVYLTYVKGLLMFDSISDVIGQKKMQKCLSGLYKDYFAKEVTPDELISCFEKYSKRHLRSYITSWLDGSVVLEELNG